VNDGKVRCPACDKEIKIGMGGIQNFLKQHNLGVSKACKINLEKKKKASAHQESQRRLQAFFTKQPKVLIPPTVPTPTRVIAYAMESTASESDPRTISRTISMLPNLPDTHAVNILMTLEKAIDKLLDLPEATESDKISMFAQHVLTDLAKEDAWEYLDPMLNRFLGFGQTTESISNKLWGGAWGLTAMVQYLTEFVGRYQISVAAARADVFHIWRTRAAMNLKIGVQIDEIRSQWVLCQL
jgi:hypothetical protein